jgi:hypothetical protein
MTTTTFSYICDALAKAYQDLADGGDFKVFKKTLEDGKVELSGQIASLRKRIEDVDEDLFGGIRACVECPYCEEGYASHCSCNPWVREANEERDKLYDRLRRLEGDMMAIQKHLRAKRGDHLVILKAAHQAKPEDEDLAKFYYVMKDEDDKAKEAEKEAEKKRKELLRAERKRRIETVRYEMDNAQWRYENKRQEYERLMKEEAEKEE